MEIAVAVVFAVVAVAAAAFDVHPAPSLPPKQLVHPQQLHTRLCRYIHISYYISSSDSPLALSVRYVVRVGLKDDI